MKLRTLTAALGITSSLLCTSALLQAATVTKSDLSKDSEKIGYALGYFFGSRMNEAYPDLDADSVLQGIRTALESHQPVLSENEMLELVTKAQKSAAARVQKERAEKTSKNLEEGQAFLKKNKQNSTVHQTSSGLQYSVIVEGSGEKPKADSTVTVHYTGTLLNGTVFDSSYERGAPATFPVNGVIQGWQEALLLMNEGSKWNLFIPANLAYGERGTPGGPIGPNEVLKFEVELLKANTPESKK